MPRIVKGISFNQEQFTKIISDRNPKPSTFLNAKSLEKPTVKEFFFEDTEKRYESFGDYVKLDI